MSGEAPVDNAPAAEAPVDNAPAAEPAAEAPAAEPAADAAPAADNAPAAEEAPAAEAAPEKTEPAAAPAAEPVAESPAAEAPPAKEPEPPAAAPAPQPEPAPAAAPQPEPAPAAAPQPQPAPAPAASSEAPPPAPAKDSLDDMMQEENDNQPAKAAPPQSPSTAQSPGKMKAANAKKSGDGHEDLKARTMFSNSTTDGVLKRTTFIHMVSNYPTAPSISIASRGENMFMRSGVGPAPGSYSLPDDEKSKFKTSSRFSFGGGSRFGLAGEAPSKLQPGPGAYNPRDPTLAVETKVGFGTSVRNKGAPASQANPGPGAYESRSTVGGGLMFTARGRHPTSYMRSRSLPGPGAYSPTLNGAYQTSPKPGFGTSVRGDFAGGAGRGQPGPGTYEMQNFKCLGKDSAKYSATSRRRVHDLNSYVTPGPGTYNAHATSFGGPGAYSCRHVDDGYSKRDKERESTKNAMMNQTF